MQAGEEGKSKRSVFLILPYSLLISLLYLHIRRISGEKNMLLLVYEVLPSFCNVIPPDLPPRTTPRTHTHCRQNCNQASNSLYRLFQGPQYCSRVMTEGISTQNSRRLRSKRNQTKGFSYSFNQIFSLHNIIL